MKTRLKHMTAALLTLIMVIGMVPLNAFAWGTEGEVCSSKFGSAYVGYDGGKYYSASKIDFIAYDSNGNISKHTKAGGNARRKFTFTNAAGAEHTVYCVESGIDFTSSNNGYTSSSGSNSRYFQNLPKVAREGIMLTTVYGWQEGLNTPVGEQTTMTMLWLRRLSFGSISSSSEQARPELSKTTAYRQTIM